MDFGVLRFLWEIKLMDFISVIVVLFILILFGFLIMVLLLICIRLIFFWCVILVFILIINFFYVILIKDLICFWFVVFLIVRFVCFVFIIWFMIVGVGECFVLNGFLFEWCLRMDVNSGLFFGFWLCINVICVIWLLFNCGWGVLLGKLEMVVV